MIFSKIKLYLLAFGGLLLTGLVVAVRVLSARNSKLSRKVETSKARIEHAKAVMISDKQADEQADVHLAEVVNEIEEDKPPKELTKPNENW